MTVTRSGTPVIETDAVQGEGEPFHIFRHPKPAAIA